MHWLLTRARPLREGTSVCPFCHALVAHKSSPSQRGHQPCPFCHQGACGAGCSPELAPRGTLGRLRVISLAQQAAQWAAHVVPLQPHSWQKTFVFICQSPSFMSAHVWCDIPHCSAMCTEEIQVPGTSPCSRKEVISFLSLPVVT